MAKEKKDIDSKIETMRENENDYPIIEHYNNALLWPEKIKGGIDLFDTYEISSVPDNPNSSLDSVEKLQTKGIIPKK